MFWVIHESIPWGTKKACKSDFLALAKRNLAAPPLEKWMVGTLGQKLLGRKGGIELQVDILRMGAGAAFCGCETWEGGGEVSCDLASATGP